MEAVRIHEYGGAPAVEEAPVPDPGPEEVLVRVTAAALNPLDVQLRSGKMHGFFPLAFPYTMGTDFAGTVERAGATAGRWRQGDRVVGRADPTKGGALAGFALVPAAYLAAVPTGIPLEEAAGIPTAAGTAWQALFEVAGLERGQTVLVHAGAGGVGSFAIQFARNAGARVIATASGTGIDVARQLGADRVIDYRSERFEDGLLDVDVVLDTVRDDTQQRSFGVLRSGGHLVSATSPPDEALAKAHNVRAAFVFHQSDGHRLEKIIEGLDAGTVRVLMDRKVPLKGFGEAFEHQASGRARGKIVVSIP